MKDKISQLVSEFDSIKNELEKWGNYVSNVLCEIISADSELSADIKLVSKPRIKDIDSFIKKALYRRKDYVDPIKDIEDKVGVRVIFLHSVSVINLLNCLKSCDKIDIQVSRNYQEEAFVNPKNFDYQSVHIVVKPKDDRSNKDLITCEIQIRTVLQHALAEVSHDTTYKGPFRNDPEILRNLSKSIALLEATDDYFCSIKTMMSNKNRKYNNILLQLTKLYQTRFPSYDKDSLDIELTDLFFKLEEKIPLDIDKIESYVKENSEELDEYFYENNSYLSKQPIILYILYSLNSANYTLSLEWPIDSDVLAEIMTKVGYSSYNESMF